MRSSLRSLETTASWSRHHFRRKETTRRFATTGYLKVRICRRKERVDFNDVTGVLIRFYCIWQVASNDAKIWKEEIFGPVLSGPRKSITLLSSHHVRAKKTDRLPRQAQGTIVKRKTPPNSTTTTTQSTGKTTNPACALLYALHAVRTFKTEDEAVQMANDTTYGLADGVFSQVMISEKQLFPFHFQQC